MTHTGSPATRALGLLALVGAAIVALLGLVISPDDTEMGDAVRLLYIHVPMAITMYLAATTMAIGSAMWLWKKSAYWDLVAASAGELGVVFAGLTLLTGMIWGKPTWGTYWVWDGRLTSTALLFVLLLGYLAVRDLPAEPTVRNRRAAIVGLIAAIDLPIIHYSVDWWRGLHQEATIGRVDATLDGLMLFTLFLAMVVGTIIYLWLLIHRFRVEYLREQVAAVGLDAAIAERRSEAGVGS